MIRALIPIILITANSIIAQNKLKAGFDAHEFLDVLNLERTHQDSGFSYAHAIVPPNYHRVFRSPEVGLKNKLASS